MGLVLLLGLESVTFLVRAKNEVILLVCFGCLLFVLDEAVEPLFLRESIFSKLVVAGYRSRFESSKQCRMTVRKRFDALKLNVLRAKCDRRRF